MTKHNAQIVALGALIVLAACTQTAPSIPSVAAAALDASGTTGNRANLLPRTLEGVHLEQVFNYNIPNVDKETGNVDLVWGSSYATKPAGMYNTAYIPYAVSQGGPKLAWYQANHPDWLEYHCDHKTLAYEFGATSNPPLDFANPQVQAFQWSRWIDAPLAAGYQGIAVDTISLGNEWHQCGHFDTSGTWVQEFTGAYGDGGFRAAVIAWETATYAHVHAQTPTATMQVNYSYEGGLPQSDNYAVMTTTDELFDERGFTNWGATGQNVVTGADWRTVVKAIQYVESKGRCYMTNGEEPGPSSGISPAERQWTIANYLLVKNDCTYMNMSGFNGKQQDYGRLILFPEYAIKIGHPTTGMVQQQGLYARSYSHGLALVNPGFKSVTFTLPNGNYKTVTGSAVGKTVTLARATGLILLK